MVNYIYEVRFPKRPDKSFTQKFNYKNDALNFAAQYPDSEVYMLELDYDDYTGTRGVGYLVDEIQIKGPEVEAVCAEGQVTGENSCTSDNPDNYVDGVFRAPKMDDDLDDDFSEEFTDSDDSDAMSDEELGEALFSAIKDHRNSK